MYDGEVDGYVTTINLAEFRYVAIREASAERADAHIQDLRDMGVREYKIDALWEAASDLKATYSPSIGDAYAIAAAKAIDNGAQNTTLLVGADDDYDVFEEHEEYTHLIERFRDTAA